MTTFLPRSAWTNHGPRVSLTPLSAGPLKGFAIHWPGNSVAHIDATSQAHIAAELEGERLYHTRPGGLGVPGGGSDIAYQYAIDLVGRVWELRGARHQSGANGNSAVNKAYGAVTLLLGTNDIPSPEMIQAVRDFRRKVWLPLWPKATRVVGHRDLYQTDCPGAHAYPLVKNGTFVSTPPPPKPPAPKPHSVVPPHILHLEHLESLGKLTRAQAAELDAWRRGKPWPPGPPWPPVPPTPSRKPLVTNYVFGLGLDFTTATTVAANVPGLLQVFHADDAKLAVAGRNAVLVLGAGAAAALGLSAPVGATTTVGGYIVANGIDGAETITRALAAAQALRVG